MKQNPESERKWAKKVWKIFKIQAHLEKSKVSQPHFSQYLYDLAFALKNHFNVSYLVIHKDIQFHSSSNSTKGGNNSMSSTTNEFYNSCIIEEEDYVEPLQSPIIEAPSERQSI